MSLSPFDNVLVKQLEDLYSIFTSGALGVVDHEEHPNLARDSLANRIYFTLPASINFQRKSEAMWQSAKKTFQDPETQFVFNLSEAIQDPDLTQQALVKHRLALLTNKHPQIWLRLSQTFLEEHDGDPLNLIKGCYYDVLEITAHLRTHKKDYPYLSGPKMANYWLFLLSRFTDIPFANREEISIIPDVHVIRTTRHLGLVEETEKVTPELVAAIWKEGLRDSYLSPADLHPALWRWSQSNFQPHLSDASTI